MGGGYQKWPSAYQTCRDKTRVYSATTACRHQSRASLFVIRGDRLGACLTPGDTPATVGRAADADFQIADSQVSRRHCQFILKAGLFGLATLTQPTARLSTTGQLASGCSCAMVTTYGSPVQSSNA